MPQAYFSFLQLAFVLQNDTKIAVGFFEGWI